MAAQPLDGPAQALQGLAELRILDFDEVAGEVTLLRRGQSVGLGQGGRLGAGQAALLEFEPGQGRLSSQAVRPQRPESD